MRKVVRLLLFGLVLSLLGKTKIMAINLEPYDIIIGDSLFAADVRIDVSRASKAGALYAKRTGTVNLDIYLYEGTSGSKVNVYKYDASSKQFALLDNNVAQQFVNDLEIFYIDNEPISKTYEMSVLGHGGNGDDSSEYEIPGFWTDPYYDMELEYPEDEANFVLGEQVSYVTCKVGTAFEVIQTFKETEYSGYSIRYLFECGYDDFRILNADNIPTSEVNVEDIDVFASNTISRWGDTLQLLNQDAVEVVYNDYSNAYYVNIIGELESFSIDNQEGEWVVLEIDLADGNVGGIYQFVSDLSSQIQYVVRAIHLYGNNESKQKMLLAIDCSDSGFKWFSVIDRMSDMKSEDFISLRLNHFTEQNSIAYNNEYFIPIYHNVTNDDSYELKIYPYGAYPYHLDTENNRLYLDPTTGTPLFVNEDGVWQIGYTGYQNEMTPNIIEVIAIASFADTMTYSGYNTTAMSADVFAHFETYEYKGNRLVENEDLNVWILKDDLTTQEQEVVEYLETLPNVTVHYGIDNE